MIYLPGYCQNKPTDQPNVIPPSPEAQAFQRYGDYPIDHSTGVPKIDIPLYEIHSGKLSLPVSLSYHASGIKINDIATYVGLGWTLQASGMVSRAVKAIPDEIGPYGYLNQTHKSKADIDASTPSADLYTYLDLISKSTYDGESDNYFYSAAGKLSGQFVYDTNNNILPLSYTESQIKRNLTNNTFEIIGDDGTDYQFTQPEYQQALEISTTYISSWHLTKMVSYDKADTISFEYSSMNTGDYDCNLSFSKQQATTGAWFNLVANRSSVVYNNMVLLTKIKFKNGFVQFDYQNGRLDRRQYKLNAVSINSTGPNSTTNLLKKYAFNYSYFNSGGSDSYNNRLKLDQINVQDANSQTINSYSFVYNTTRLPAYYNPNDQNYIIGSYQGWLSMDYWGYYNGAYNTHLIPSLPASNTSNYSGLAPADRNPNENYMQADMLQQITYPTGGTTIFTFEANRDNSNTLIGGLRINTITSTSGAGATPITKRYAYNAASVLNLLQYPYSYQYYQMHETVTTSGGNKTVIREDRTVYFGSYPWPLAEHSGSSILYTNVTEYIDGGSAPSLRTDYVYESDNDRFYTVNCPRLDNTYYADRSWSRGNLINTAYYKYQNGNYIKLKDVGCQYTPLKTGTINTGLKAFRVMQEEGTLNEPYYPDTKTLFYYFDEQVDIGVKKLQNEYTTEYDDNQTPTISTSNQYQYGSNAHLYPTQEISTDSKGVTITKNIKYVPDITLSGTAETARQQLLTLNKISPVLQQTLQKGSSTVTEATSYNIYNSYPYPSLTTKQYGSGAAFNQYAFTGYSNGNLLGVQSLDGPVTSYKWGYNNQYPVAEIKNAAGTEFYYEGFEESVATGVTTGVAHTGTHYTTNPSVVWGLPNSKAYVISYWYRVSGVWKYSGMLSYVPTQTSNVYLMSGGDAYDDIRICPSDAVMTTYTYAPLVGITSSTDAKGMTTYYEYDNFQRLKNIKDKDGNIIKHTDYYYQGN